MLLLLRLVSARVRARARALVLALRAALAALRARAGGWARALVLVLVLAAVGAAAFAAGRRTARPRVEYQRVIVPAVAPAPDTVVRWRERIVYRTVHAEQRAEAPGTGSAAVAEFCRAAAAAAAAPDTVRLVDTVRVAAAPTPGQRLALAYAGRYDGRTLELWSLLSDGGRAHERFRGVRVPHEWTIRGDSALVRSSRWWWLREVARSAPAAGAGALTGGAEGAALAAGACMIGRLVF